jgi:hypothetical protein
MSQQGKVRESEKKKIVKKKEETITKPTAMYLELLII